MHLVYATFVNNEVKPGWTLMRGDVPLGKRYRIDLDRIEQATLGNSESGEFVQLDIVYVLEPGVPGWLPLLALRIDES